jgi:hypothetical protein
MAADGWIRSSKCSPTQNCVEVNRSVTGLVRVRDSKGESAAILAFAGARWVTFLRELR